MSTNTIKPGKIRPGKARNATVHDVSNRAGLSIATVSRVLNNSPNVREATRGRVLKAAQELGYTFNHSARALKRQRTDIIGAIFPSIGSGFFGEVLKGANEVAKSQGLHLMVEFSFDREDESKLVMDYVHGHRVDAVILMNLGVSDAFIRDAARGNTPIVLIDRPVEDAAVATVRMDNVTGADEAMTHLLGCGYRRIAVIKGPVGTFDAEQRWLGCRRAADRVGYALDESLIWTGEFMEQSGYQLMSSWLDAGKPLPEAMFSFNDPMALGVLKALRERGLNAPGDMALVGFDDVNYAEYLGLTTVRCPMKQMGQAASRVAIDLINKTDTDKNQVLSTELVIRETCGSRLRGQGDSSSR